MKNKHTFHPLPLMALGALALLSALWAGLIRLGWQLPPVSLTLPAAHGPLFVSGFLGTVIALERAVAISFFFSSGKSQYSLYLGPALTGVGAVMLVLGLPVAPWLLTIGSLGLVGVSVFMVRKQPALFTVTMGVGALLWLVGNGLWLVGWPIPRVALWWAGFLLLTIAGERLELSRVLRLSDHSRRLFLAAVALFVAGLGWGLSAFDAGTRLAGLGMVALALWLLWYDVARRTVYRTGLTRFIAFCLLVGYLWLLVSGTLTLLYGGVMAGFYYDALLHALFLGFVFSMIFGHAPIVVPALLGRAITYHPRFYIHLSLLHLSLLLRVAGDLAPWWQGRRWGGLLNEIAILLFLFMTAMATRQPNVAQEQHAT